MKKLTALLVTAALCASLMAPAFAADYSFGSGPDTGEIFGNPTGYDAPVSPDPLSENLRRNKDAAYLPPPYFYGSGYIPTDPSSPYHDNTPPYAGQRDAAPSFGGIESFVPPAGDIASGGSPLLPSTSDYESYLTAPLYYDDGSIGALYIHKLDKTLTVYEGESLNNMTRGIGHFESTSAWDGNCAFAGHNRGAAPYFSFVKDLAVGDIITYTTLYGTRTYVVYNKVKISETDYSGLGWSANNILSMITCVENEPPYRWLVQCSQIS